MTLPVSALSASTRQIQRATAPARSMTEAKQSSEPPDRLSPSEHYRERALTVPKATRSFSNAMREADSSKKEAARKRIDDIKERIKMLRMLVSFGPASKGVIREIRELAQALGQAAKVLGDSGGDANQAGSRESVAPAKATSAEQPGLQEDMESLTKNSAQEDAGRQSEASDERGIDAAAAGTPMTLKMYRENQRQAQQEDQPSAADKRQRGEDAQLIEDAVRRLKALLALAESARGTDNPDSRKQISDIQAHLEESGSTALGLGLEALQGTSVSFNV